MGQREDVVRVAQSYVGCKQGSSQHKKLVDTFNKWSRNYKDEVANYTCPWCAIACSSWSNLANCTIDIVPRTYNCGRWIDQAKKMGIWVENDNYKPQAGDFIIYYWSAPTGDCTYGASHIGVVEKVSGSTITVIEGNMGSPSHCGRRSIPVGWRYIRGFVTPRYKSSSSSSSTTTAKTSYTGSMPTANIKYGSKGENVKRWQNFLRWYYGSHKNEIAVDGKFGNITKKYTVQFQKEHKLTQDGIVGANTRAAAKASKK